MWTYTYNPKGEVIKKSKGANDETWVYGYDHRNQMLTAAYSAIDGGSVTQRVTYVYDALGNRIERQGWDGSTTTTTRYALDGWDSAKPSPIGNEQFDVWAELDGTSALVLRRVTGPGFDEHVARQSAAGAVEWYAADHLGSVRLILDNSGTATATLAYDAFGNSLAGPVSDHGYAGYRLDSLTGLYSAGDRRSRAPRRGTRRTPG